MCTTMSKVFGTDLQRVYTVALTQLWVAITQRQSLLSGATFVRSFDVVQQSFAGFLDSHRLSLICCERIVRHTAFFASQRKKKTKRLIYPARQGVSFLYPVCLRHSANLEKAV